MSIHRDEIRRNLYEEAQLLNLYGNEPASSYQCIANILKQSLISRISLFLQPFFCDEFC